MELLSVRRLMAIDVTGCTSDGSWLQSFLETEQSQAIAGAVLRPQNRDYPDDGFLRRDSRGLAYYHDEGHWVSDDPADQPVFANSILRLGSGQAGGPSMLDLPPAIPIVPIYHSNPAATQKIYLDFDGELISGTAWNNQNYTGSYNTGPVINAPAFSIDADRSNFSTAELTAIREVWARMAEDFAPFQVDVTTEYPGDAIFTAGGQAIRVMMSTDTDATSGSRWFANAGGVAYLESWTWTDGSPVWVFHNRLGNSAKNMAEAGSHEVGHAFNLLHDGRTSPSEAYYYGHGGTAQTSWAPIMGVGYNRNVVQWSKGDYTNANNLQDDLTIISGQVAYRTDDHGNAVSGATALTLGAAGQISAAGIIEKRADVDAFTFFTQSGTVTINADPFELSSGKANLDIQLQVRDSVGTVVTTVNNANILNAAASLSLAKGTYTILIDGVGKTAVAGDEGYTDYGSLGAFTISGTAILNSAPVVAANSSLVSGAEGQLITNAGTWSDINPLDVVTLTASVGDITKNANGTWSWQIMPSDQTTGEVNVTVNGVDDLGASSSVVFRYSASNNPPQLTVTQSSIVGDVLSPLTNSGTWSDVATDNVVLTASLGAITKNNDGTWTWALTPSAALNNETVTINALDKDGASSSVNFALTALVAVSRRSVYYKGSTFATTSVEAALDTGKTLAKAGASPQLLGYANLINTDRGINGLVFDVAGLAVTVTAADFRFKMSPQGAFVESSNPPSDWETAPAPTGFEVTPGNATTAARIRIEWADNAISNRWLQIRIAANSNTGLINPEVYYIGHLLGKMLPASDDGLYKVRGFDISEIRPLIGTLAMVTSAADIDKDGKIRGFDIAAVRPMVGVGLLRNITIPAAGSGGEGEGDDPSLASIASVPAIENGLLGNDTPVVGWNVGRIEKASRVEPRWTGLDYSVPQRTIRPGADERFPTHENTDQNETAIGAFENHLPHLLSLDQYFAHLGLKNRL